jgi:hypothetical protein
MEAVRAIAGTIACTLALCLAGVLGPTGAAAALLLLPLPMLVLGGVSGLTACVLAVVMSVVLLAFAVGADVGGFYLAIGGIPVMLSVWALRTGYRIETSIAVSALGLLVGVVVSILWMHGDLETLRVGVHRAWNESFDQTLDLYRMLGVSDEELTDLQLQRDQLLSGLITVAPALGVVIAGAVWFVNIRIARRWLPWPQLYNLHAWQAPAWLIWVLIVAGFGLFAPSDDVVLVARNVFVVVLAGYFCQGLAIVSYYLQRLQLPTGLRVASYLLIGFQQVVAGVVLMLGVFDFWGDFRRLSVSAADAQGGADAE